MKYCKKCGYENLNEQIYCRHCGYEFEYFDWDSVKRENLTINSLMVERRNIEYERYQNKLNKSLKLDWIILIFSSIIFIPSIIYGLYHSWILYWLLLLVYGCILCFEIHLIFILFNIKITIKIGEHEFYNNRLEGIQIFLGGIFILFGAYPFTFYPKFAIALLLSCSLGLPYLLTGINVLLRPKVFNEYNDFTFLSTYALMWIAGGNGLLTIVLYAILDKVPLILRVILLSTYIVILFSIIFPDVVNKYNKHDIRGKDSLYFFYVHGVLLIYFIILLIFGKMFGLLFE